MLYGLIGYVLAKLSLYLSGYSKECKERKKMREELRSVKCFLLDMDGTVYLSGKLLRGAAETIQTMRARGRVVFLTNNTSRSKDDYVERLNNLGLSVTRADVFTAADAALHYIKRRYENKKVYLFGTKSLHQEFLAAGVALDDEAPELVAVGFHTDMVYADLVKLCNFIRDGVPYILTHPDKNCPHDVGLLPDVGSLLELIRASTNREPEAVFGKPCALMGEMITAALGYEKKEVLMMGDRLETDMQFAFNCGFASALVLSGATDRALLQKSGMKPDLVLPSIKYLFEEGEAYEV